MYYAYENWRAHGHVTKVHRRDCRDCNDGHGRDGGTRADNGRWIALGNLDSPDDALAEARALVNGGTVRFCRNCGP